MMQQAPHRCGHAVRLAALAGASVLAGAGAASAKSPPSLQKTLAELDKAPMCSKEPVITAMEPGVLEQMRKAGYAIPTDFCYPVAPKGFAKEMRKRRMSFTCGSLFDVDLAGVGRLVETRCEVATTQALDPEWRRYFEAVLVAAVKRTSPRVTFEPARDDARGVRAGWYTVNSGADLPPMKLFHKAAVQ